MRVNEVTVLPKSISTYILSNIIQNIGLQRHVHVYSPNDVAKLPFLHFQNARDIFRVTWCVLSKSLCWKLYCGSRTCGFIPFPFCVVLNKRTQDVESQEVDIGILVPERSLLSLNDELCTIFVRREMGGLGAGKGCVRDGIPVIVE